MSSMRQQDLRFRANFSMIVCGISGSGKTSFTLNLLRAAHRDRHNHELFQDTRFLQNILFFYAEMQPAYEAFQRETIGHITWIAGPPTVDLCEEHCREFVGKGGSIMISDDHGDNVDADLLQIVEKKRNHLNLSSVIIMHNLFSPNPRYRHLSRQVGYIVLFNVARDVTQFSRLAQQMFPHNNAWLVEAFNDVMRTPYNHVLFDFHATTPKMYRVRTNALAIDSPQIVLYDPKNV